MQPSSRPDQLDIQIILVLEKRRQITAATLKDIQKKLLERTSEQHKTEKIRDHVRKFLDIAKNTAENRLIAKGLKKGKADTYYLNDTGKKYIADMILKGAIDK